MLHLAKGEIVGFAHDEDVEMHYIETTGTLEMEETEYRAPRNWIPERNWRKYEGHSEISTQKTEILELHGEDAKSGEISPKRLDKVIKSKTDDTGSEISRNKSQENELQSTFEDKEAFETDFLISPGDVYPNRKVKLQDAEIANETRRRFEEMCDRHQEAFSKNNKDIGRTTLIEMEIDTGDSLPVAQNPYTLPLKHHEWVRKEIETLEKAGVIERSLSPWASPVIVVPKKSAPDEPPRRRLCVDYRKVNSLQQEIKRTDKGTGCLSLYPLPKIDEMFAKLKGARFFSTIDLRSGYYHIGLTRESRAKSAFVVPMGKWEFKRTPFGLSQAPAYFQLLIDKVLMGCSKFAMGYLDDIIIFSSNELEHLQHIEEIFKRLERFGLKMKWEKCDFFKKHIQYLGHLISEEGFTPLPEKLESIRKMPRPKTPKEVKQFLGLIGYYRKFVPRFSDIARSLTNLTRHDVDFKWTDKCDKAFKHLKELLMEHPILRYPDPQQGYTLFTDASGIGWAGVLTQEFADEKGKKKHHPISYISGQFRGSQQNWAALTKEAYAIYMSVRKLSFYITDAEVTIKCDHLPLKKFLQKQTLNAKVNNWAVELEQFNLKLEWIQGAKNTLADSLSRLLEVDPEAKLQPEREGHEFGTFCFEELNETGEISPDCWTPATDSIENIEITYDEQNIKEVKLPLKTKQIIELQKRDTEARHIVNKLHKDNMNTKMFILHEGVLCRLWTEERETFRCIFIPEVLRDPLLVLAHNQNGHNGGRRTYMALKRLYYWPGMRGQVFKHCKNCQECMLQNQANTSGDFKHFKMPEIPMQLICMDLVGPISPVTTRGNRFILTCIDMLTGFTVAIPIPDKSANTVCDAYRAHIYCTFGGSARILTDNGTEFKNEQMDELCRQLNIKRVYSPVYTPEANGRLEAWHRFFKACVAKHIRGNAAEWDEVVPLAAAAYNFFPCQAAGESPFVLMFGRDPITPFAKLLEPAPRYWGDRGGHLKMDLLKKLYLLTAENVKRAREGRDLTEKKQENSFKVNDLVLVRDVNSGAFAPRYMPNYRVIEVHGPNRIVVRDEKGNESVRRASHLKICEPKDKVAAMVPEDDEYKQFGRNTRLLLHPKDVADLQFTPAADRKGEIPPEVEVSLVNVDGEISPETSINRLNTNGYNESIVDSVGSSQKTSEISLKVDAHGKSGNPPKNSTWFQSPMTCVSKWSKALKTGVVYSMGLDINHTAYQNQKEDDKHGFSFFL